MRIATLIVSALILSGCAATYKQNTLAQPSAKLVRGNSVAIATPANGFYGKTEYQASGNMTSLAVRAAFARFSNTTTVLPQCKDLACLKGSNIPAHNYYVVPEILHWEDRATEWSGIPDRIEVKISIYDGQTSREVASTIISGKSKWATFGGDHPQDLLPEPLNAYVESLY
jgi:Domain of unknown function (DUF4823)